MKMPFGKHRGTELSELPDDYLRWLYSSARVQSATLEDAIYDEYWARFSEPEPERTKERTVIVEIRVERLSLTDRQRDVALKMVDAGYRQLAMKNHPDVGGDTRAMVAINMVVELMRLAIGERASEETDVDG